ncbi:PREDICTED: F-box/kelch-repeat protein At4g39550-like [Camelina sativa]|uniref:F-box/kelch-repeat protein At4g39550-like n=1 Tax=Camelina sativa TaxID=90675 RepID=A0ABM0UUD7_CAMSA|nr:PREDICTED: F-box/kelch-repeat protein At4g39550-like [Camelina sativa]
MSSPEKKRRRKKKKPSLILPQSTTPNPSLPDDLVLSCLARVPRLYYPTLSLVSKSFRSLIASPELYKIRSSLNRTESCLYVCIQDGDDDPNPKWFTLCLKPNRTLTNDEDLIEKKKKKKKKSSGYALAVIPVLHSRGVHWSGLVAVGSNIYNIGGPIDQEVGHSSSVSILDCQSHTWGEGPSMRVERNYPAANLLDGKIYMTGGCKDCSNASNWMEVFDPKRQTWEPVLSPGAEIGGCSVHKSAVVDGEILFANSRGLIYNPKEGRWRRMPWDMDGGWVWWSYCVVENVLYYYYEGEFNWYDSKARLWKTLKGLKGLPRFARYGGRMADYGGKMAVFWDKIVTSSGCKKKEIWCAVIALERRDGEEIWGKVEWHDAVHTVPLSYKVVYALSPTV